MIFTPSTSRRQAGVSPLPVGLGGRLGRLPGVFDGVRSDEQPERHVFTVCQRQDQLGDVARVGRLPSAKPAEEFGELSPTNGSTRTVIRSRSSAALVACPRPARTRSTCRARRRDWSRSGRDPAPVTRDPRQRADSPGSVHLERSRSARAKLHVSAGGVIMVVTMTMITTAA